MIRMCKECGRGIISKRTLRGAHLADVDLDAVPQVRMQLVGHLATECSPVTTYSLHAETCPAANGRTKRRVAARVKP